MSNRIGPYFSGKADAEDFLKIGARGRILTRGIFYPERSNT